MVRRRGHAERHRPTARELFRSGEALERSGQRSRAIDAYRAAIALDAFHPQWHFRLGRTLERTRDWAGAATAYRAAIERNPTRPYWHVRLGHILTCAREWTGAARAYERALALDDSRMAWREQHAAALRRAHDRDGLDHAVGTLLAHEPDMPPLERQLLAADPRRFDVRRQIARFVTDRIDNPRDRRGVAAGVATDAGSHLGLLGAGHAPGSGSGPAVS